MYFYLQKVYVKDLRDFLLGRTRSVRADQGHQVIPVTATRKRKKRNKRKKRSPVDLKPSRNTGALLFSYKCFLCVFLFQEKPDRDQSTEPKTDPGSAGAKLSLQGDGDPGSTPGVYLVQLPAKADQPDPSCAAAADALAGPSLGPREQARLRLSPSPMASLLDRYGDAGSRPNTHLTSTDLRKPYRFYQK